MSQLERLLIQGVRSFDNKTAETLKFQTPLTLIVGPNGTGKTTIIECLKYATTGSLPPNSTKGGAFIHDPGIAGENEVAAVVKILFRNTSEIQMVVERRQQLTVKRNTRSVKTLDGSFAMSRNGERQSVTTKIGELDRLVPQNLGVSKAILEHVIFCHQDESYWPLSEPSALKKKFDEIFEAQKYTKALDKIKDIRKKKGQDLQKHKLVDQQAKDTKTRADKAEKEGKRVGAELDQLRADIKENEQKASNAHSKYEHAFDQAAEYNSTLKSLEGNRQQRAFQLSSIQKIKQNLQVRNEPDDWLRSELENYEQRVRDREQQDHELRQQHQQVAANLEELRGQSSRKVSEQGRLQQLHEEQEKRIDKRKALVQDKSRLYHVRGFESALDDARIAEFMVRLQNLSNERQDSIRKNRKQREANVTLEQQKLSHLQKQQNTFENEQTFSKKQISENEQKVKAFRSELACMRVDEGEVAILDSQIEDLEASLQRAKSESAAADWDEKLQVSDGRIQALKDRLTQLNTELRMSTDRQNDISERDITQRGLVDSQRRLEKMQNVHSPKFKTMLDHHWDPANLKREFAEAMAQRARRLNEAERSRMAANRDLEQTDIEISRVQKDIAKSTDELTTCEKRLGEFLTGTPEDYPKEFKEIQENRDQLKSDVEGAGHVRDFYEKAIVMAEEKHKCRLCLRKFEDEKAEQKFFEHLRKKLSKDHDVEKIHDELTHYELILGKARDAGPAFETWQKLTKTALPQQRKAEKDLTPKRIEMVRRLEEHDRVVNELEQEKADLDGFAVPVENISKCQDDIVTLSAKLSDIQKRQQGADLPRALKKIQEQHALTIEGLSVEREVKEKINNEKVQSRFSINDIEAKLGKASTELGNAHRNLSDKSSKARQIEELNSLNQAQRDQIQATDGKLQDLSPHIEAIQDDLQGLRSKGEQDEGRLQEEAAALTEVLNRLTEANDAIQHYVSAGDSLNLNRCQREITNLEQQTKQTENEKNELVKSINKIRDELKSQAETKRIITDNLDYREMQQSLDGLEREIATLESQYEEADREKWNSEGSRWRNRHMEFNAVVNDKMGEARAKDQVLLQLMRDWDTDYKHAEDQAKLAHITVEATKAAVEDLGKYGSALDKAIMKFHSMKMDEINHIVEELWAKTYKGTDVDKILIRSDSEGARANQSYNYRVCMMKKDVEMDMRGRCSAGQKVLASIIIRLALAECFGVNCGLIALDEPTTNLDSDNIKALAEALHELIEARRHQSNFQLIVITHDEEFIKAMKCASFVDHYYRLSRNDAEKTVIMRQQIRQIAE